LARVRGRSSGTPQAAWNTYIWVDSADETTAKVREAGGNVMAEPFDVFGAGRMAVFSDPEGAVFSVWQAREHRGARIVNEPGALNFNVWGSNTRSGVTCGLPSSLDDLRTRSLSARLCPGDGPV